MSNLITQSNLITELEITPSKSKYEIVDIGNWQYNPETEGAYLPRKLLAQLRGNSPFLQLNFFHEYFGHGSFCEYSNTGKKIVQYEQELSEIEIEILGVNELPSDLVFKLDKNNPKFEGYKKLRLELYNFATIHHNYYEGFAYWLEQELSLEQNLGELYMEKKNIIDPQYIYLVQGLNSFVKQNNKQDLLEKIFFQ